MFIYLIYFFILISTKKSGDIGELVAIKYLKSKGYKILDTNFKFSRFGEIDIICSKDLYTIFIEVKYRNNTNFGIPEESITKNKLRKFGKTMQYYIAVNKLDFEKVRFDAITIFKGEKSYKLTHYKNLEI